ncbi:lysophospholipase [Devosia pacifica]|uniref:Lysophospholipase n=1 Tax=Devosia pacifica TaxID=1335967 RepID=A0A918VV35_9HYPH|nr:alpha/beta hydrolase [Devosia pacifica]GHA27018.1 lysophospholipase [Devosia pacifica]
MQNLVAPEGPRLVMLPSNPAPEGMRAGYMKTTDGIRLRYAIWPKAASPRRGTVCILQGRTEFIEKYFETVADFRRRGFAVATFDWRGQGGSDRLIDNPQLGHVESFGDYGIDLESFHRQVLLPDCPAPFYLVGHSMGGLAGLLGVIRDRTMFDRALLLAPMLSIKTGLSMRNTARLMKGLAFFGMGAQPVGRRGDKGLAREGFANNPLTSDLKRYMRIVDVLTADPGLGIGRPTIQWLATASDAMARVATDTFPQALRVPVLMLAAGSDTVVSSAAIEHLGLRLRTGRHLVVPAARHELLMESDAVRGQALAAFDAFITEQSG